MSLHIERPNVNRGKADIHISEFMPNKGSHGVATNNFVRNIFSCVGGVVAEPLIVAIGNGWLFTILGIWCLVSGIAVVWSMKRFGETWRVNAEKHEHERK